jgi:glutamyl-tRNA synthetase
MDIVTRFAPSPTGSLHLGSARTALFNFLYARGRGGTFFLRIEDTDLQRSTPEAVQQIMDALRWLRLDWDEPVVFQSKRRARHVEVGRDLVARGQAYWCHCTLERLERVREVARLEKRCISYDRHCRDLDLHEISGSSILRLKAPLTGEVQFHDQLKGDLTLQCDTLDDMVLLRSDGSPTYMLAVVVDDHDMKITHIIRGDDHLTNAFRQINLYRALGWHVPDMAHIPLIHNAKGMKLSKRHGDVGIEYYKERGIFPEALESALVRLGWAHENDEKITRQNALHWFDFRGLSPSPARFDEAKVWDLNKYYLQHMALETLWDMTGLEGDKIKALQVLPELVKRAKTLHELTQQLRLYVMQDVLVVDKALLSELNPKALACLQSIAFGLKNIQSSSVQEGWAKAHLERCVQEHELKLSEIAKALRIVLLGETVSIGIYHVLEVLGPEWIKKRIEANVPKSL